MGSETNYEVDPGTRVDQAALEMLKLANDTGAEVRAEFNGFTLVATPGTSVEAILAVWDEYIRLNAIEHEKRAAEDRRKVKDYDRLIAAIQVPSVWTEAERDALDAAFKRSEARGRGHFETLFAIAAESLRLAQKRATPPPEPPVVEDAF